MIFLDFELAMEFFHAKQLSYCVRMKKQEVFSPSVYPALYLK